ncbi:MAG: hypothetical protein J3T61_03275 [Candidatus Brocadiales bacterium]|nr:hypothetical protein [Candidatus Bathyanammoxibius sp.]
MGAIKKPSVKGVITVVDFQPNVTQGGTGLDEIHPNPVFNNLPHVPQWYQPGEGTGTDEANTVWADYLQCWCGLTRGLPEGAQG